MDRDVFLQIRRSILKKHYSDKVHYSSSPGSTASDIKSGIDMVYYALESIDTDDNQADVLTRAANKLENTYREFATLPSVLSDKTDPYGYTCGVLKNCAEAMWTKAREARQEDERQHLIETYNKVVLPKKKALFFNVFSLVVNSIVAVYLMILAFTTNGASGSIALAFGCIMMMMFNLGYLSRSKKEKMRKSQMELMLNQKEQSHLAK